ncbi:MAG: winged helix-turn-helix transcriptional regulator [Bacteroidia bacterium]|nr:winged helix-turn-helix transcriptional regulator [Bacteroidia bacterium]MDW8134070.1 winged helix-turn-helix transcriptional regulator [Bacteroidia bacterium]
MKKRRETMDQLDHQLLAIMAENPTESYAKIREKLGISIGTVYLRAQRLKETGIIKGFQLILDPKKLGYSLIVAVRLNVADTIRATKSLELRPEIGTVHLLTGEFNLLAYAYLPDVDALHKLLQFFHNELRADRVEVQIIIDTPLQRSVPIPPAASASSSTKKRSKTPASKSSKK